MSQPLQKMTKLEGNSNENNNVVNNFGNANDQEKKTGQNFSGEGKNPESTERLTG